MEQGLAARRKTQGPGDKGARGTQKELEHTHTATRRANGMNYVVQKYIENPLLIPRFVPSNAARACARKVGGGLYMLVLKQNYTFKYPR